MCVATAEVKNNNLNPCLFTTPGHYNYCCCDRTSPCRNCCKEEEAKQNCPAASWVSEVTVEFIRHHVGEASYKVGDVHSTAQQIFDCDHDVEWAEFRQALAKYDAASLSDFGAQDHALVSQAERLVGKYNLSLHVLGREKRSVQIEMMRRHLLDRFLYGTHVPPLDELFCVQGFVTASFVVALKQQSSRCLRDAQMLLLFDPTLDLHTSTAWPIGFWDLALNLGRHKPARITSMFAYLRDGHVPKPKVHSWEYPGPYGHSVSKWREPRAQVKISAYLEHPALDIEIASILLEIFPTYITLTLIWAGNSSYQSGSNTLQHVCSQFEELCFPPHMALPADDSAPWQPADLLLCSWYNHCLFLEQWAGSELPLISYYGGYPWNSWAVRWGTQTVSDLLNPLHNYMKRGSGTADVPPAFLLADAPYTAEILHSFTGIQLPVYRPLSSYVRAKYAPEEHLGLLVLRSNSMSKQAKSGPHYFLLKMFAGEDFGLKLHLQDGFHSFEAISKYRAVLYWPGPHSWVLMQFRELYNMNMPLFVPDEFDYLIHAAVWHENLYNNLKKLPSGNWHPPHKYWIQRHPFSPWLPDEGHGGADGSEYARANMYWVQWLEFFQWPHVQHFHGIPHLLDLVRKLRYRTISWRMAEVNHAACERAKTFWRASLSGLFPQ